VALRWHISSKSSKIAGSRHGGSETVVIILIFDDLLTLLWRIVLGLLPAGSANSIFPSIRPKATCKPNAPTAPVALRQKPRREIALGKSPSGHCAGFISLVVDFPTITPPNCCCGNRSHLGKNIFNTTSLTPHPPLTFSLNPVISSPNFSNLDDGPSDRRREE
jgi:hypothetical protein